MADGLTNSGAIYGYDKEKETSEHQLYYAHKIFFLISIDKMSSKFLVIDVNSLIVILLNVISRNSWKILFFFILSKEFFLCYVSKIEKKKWIWYFNSQCSFPNVSIPTTNISTSHYLIFTKKPFLPWHYYKNCSPFWNYVIAFLYSNCFTIIVI